MAIRSAGLLIYRRSGGRLQVLLVHPGGPFWARKDEGAWSIPKGLVDQNEDELAAARALRSLLSITAPFAGTVMRVNVRPGEIADPATPQKRRGTSDGVSGHMATLSFKNNKKVYWDTKTEKVRYS